MWRLDEEHTVFHPLLQPDILFITRKKLQIDEHRCFLMHFAILCTQILLINGLANNEFLNVTMWQECHIALVLTRVQGLWIKHAGGINLHLQEVDSRVELKTMLSILNLRGWHFSIHTSSLIFWIWIMHPFFVFSGTEPGLPNYFDSSIPFPSKLCCSMHNCTFVEFV